MGGDGRIARAEAEVREFIAGQPGFAIDPVQPEYRGGTNCITLGTHEAAAVVYKHLAAPERWRNEVACLQHFSSTGLVPQVHALVPERLIVMRRLGGVDVGATTGRMGAAQAEALASAVGDALGALAETKLPVPAAGYDPARDYAVIPWSGNPAEALSRYLTTARRVQRAIPAYAEPFFERSLSRLEQERALLEEQPLMLMHEDVGNLRVDGSRVVGFYDFEMCRAGTRAMQLGVAASLCGSGRLAWRDLLDGFERRVGAVAGGTRAITAMAHLYAWIRICYWGWWDGDPVNEMCRRAVAADAAYWDKSLREVTGVICGSLAAWEGGRL
jgi:aminoglycoside phosphotransferase (APT) family kinase protein